MQRRIEAKWVATEGNRSGAGAAADAEFFDGPAMLAFLDLDADARGALAAVWPVAEPILPTVLDEFYQKVNAPPSPGC